MKLLRVRCIFYICTELQRYYYVSNIYVKIFIICYKFYLQGWKWCLDILRNIFPTCADECFAYRSKWNNSSSSGRYSSEYIRHYASAVFVNSSFWDDSKKVKDDLKMEGHTQDYIGSYMSYVQMLGTTCRLVIKCNSLCPIHKTLFYTTYISTH